MSSGGKIALTLSLLLNVFFVAAVAGVLLMGGRLVTAPIARRPGPANIWVAAEALPQPDRSKFRAMLREQAAALQPDLRVARLARREAAMLIAAPRYDGEAVATALGHARTGETQARAAMDAALVVYMNQLTPAERATLADALVVAGPGRVRAEIRAAEPAVAP